MRLAQRGAPLFRIALAAGIVICANCEVSSRGTKPERGTKPFSEVVSTSDVEWEPLNPARGDKSPMAGTLWGDRNGSGPTGFLLRPVDNFESPPHIHNIAYRGVVIRGTLHNDDPNAAEMWMPAGSFWTQPAGDVHITAAKGTDTLAYIEIDEGPYLVRPPEDAFETAQRPINVHESNVVWVPVDDGSEVAFLWGSPRANRWSGTLVKLSPGFDGSIDGRGFEFGAVVIRGRPELSGSGETLELGSYFSSTGETAHPIACNPGEECIVYVRARGLVDIDPARP